MSNRKKQADRIMAWFAKIEILTINFPSNIFFSKSMFLKLIDNVKNL